MLAGLSRSGKTTLLRALKRRGFASLSGKDMRSQFAGGFSDWDEVHAVDPDRHADAVKVVRSQIGGRVQRGAVVGVVVYDERFHLRTATRRVAVAAAPNGFLKTFVMLDVSYDIYRARYDASEEQRRRHDPDEFRKLRRDTDWPNTDEGFRLTVYVRVGDVPDQLPPPESSAITLTATDDQDYENRVFPELLKLIHGTEPNLR